MIVISSRSCAASSGSAHPFRKAPQTHGAACIIFCNSDSKSSSVQRPLALPARLDVAVLERGLTSRNIRDAARIASLHGGFQSVVDVSRSTGQPHDFKSVAADRPASGGPRRMPR